MASRECWLVTDILGRFGKPARQALRPGCEELRCTAREEMPEMEARAPDPKSPWWSAERRASRVMGRRGASQAPRHAALLRAHRMPLHPGACRRSAHPSSGWKKLTKTRAQMRRGNESGCLKS
jgi:hypothetical protein